MQRTAGNGKAFSTHDAQRHQQRARSTPGGWPNLPNYALTATSLLTALVACSLTLLPMILYLHRFPLMAPFSMFANDAFYYLDVARNSQATPFFTFDGTHPTNGFHPVWQSLLYLAVKYRWLDLAHPAQAIAQLFHFNLAILSAATFGLALAAARFLKHPWLALLTVCPGWMWFLVAVSAPGYLANWSFLNGMETSIEIFFLACALLCYWPASRLQLWLPPMCFFLGMMVLSRLDDVFFLFPILGFLVFSAPRRSRRIAIASSFLPFLMIGLYLLYNLHSVGRAIPISGATKAGHALKDNLRLAYNVFAPVAWDAPRGEASIGYSIFAEGYMRVFQMLFPMLVSALYLTRRSVAHRAFVDWLCVGVLLKGTYNLFFVALFAQGHWYYGASVFVANLVLSLALDYALISAPGLTGFSWHRKYLAVLGEILLVLFSMNAFVNDKLNQEPGLQMQVVFERRAVLTQMVRAAGGNGFLEFDDGILGFATGIRSISGFGLVGDTEARLARKHERFFDLAVARGDALILARGGYANQLEAFSKAAVSDPHQQLYGIHAAEFRKYALQPVATDGATDVRLYRLIRRP